MGAFDDGWTLVRRGRRRQRTRQPYWDRMGDRSDGWTERAPPVSSRKGRDQFPYPSRPVPPPRTSRYVGPQSRSFASVVRQGNQRPARRFVSPRAEGSEQVRRQPADPQFRCLARKMHALIKMVHHLQNVAPKPGKPQPRMISRMVNILSTMIRPSSPTEKTVEMIKGNADNWGYTTLIILQDHYESGLEILLEEISGLLVQDWKSPFEVAVRWAKRNLPHVTQEVIDHVEALITARGDGNNQPQAGVTEQTHGPQQTTATVATMTEGTSQRTEQVSQSAQAEPHQDQDFQPPQMEPPQEQRQPSLRGPRGVVLTEDLLLGIEEESEGDSPDSSMQRDFTESSIYADLEDLFGCTPVRDTGAPAVLAPMRAPTVSKQGTERPVQQVVQAQVHQELGDLGEASRDSIDGTSTPVPQLYRVTRHVNSERKMIDWGLSVRKKWLIIGDSNLSRIPAYDIPDLQIDSYPGANFRHAEALIKKATSSLTVEKVLLSFGLNHRNQKARETSVKQLQGAVRAAKNKFPYAEIWIPQINFSAALSRDEKQTLLVLNGHIERNMPCLSALQNSDFHTEKDNVHWTKKTASAMLKHWATLLNLTAL